ncbi:MAG TPA: hypothetical protein G4O17_00645 [Dehalococcoidia bacterium]|nr:hypothetical protein [Dehalococcoidia bacterium]
MDAGIFLYAFGVWVIFGILATINGVIRNKFYTPKIGEYPAHVISTVIAIFFIIIGTYLFVRFVKIDYSSIDLLLIGGFWVVLTVLFEFVFGHYVVGQPWEKLLADYNIIKGRLWSLFLFTLLISPLLIGLLLRKNM